MKKIFYSFFSILFLNFSVFADESLLQIKQKLERIEKDLTDLQIVVFTKKNINLSSENKNEDITPKITVFDMRLRDIENELHTINLNYENISFEIDDLKTSLEDVTFELNNAIIELNNAIISINTKINNNTQITSDSNSVLENETEIITQNQTEQENTLGTLIISSDELSDSNDIEATETETNILSPEEQFQVAFDNLRGQKFEIAKTDLELFIKEHDSHNLTGSAHYWLGEILLLQKEYREAALVFAEGYQKYPDSIKSPDSLYKLAETLIKIEKKEEACNTFKQFILKYPSNILIDKTESRIVDLQCS